jgi:putative toxin-antitoxin system antitoxin component (TIGR02293 family)
MPASTKKSEQASQPKVSRPIVSRQIVRFKRRGASLGLANGTTPALIQQVEDGFPFDSLRRLESNSGLDLAVLASVIGLPERTLARRRTSGRLAPEESERLLRISSIFEKSVELFEGNVRAAANWLTSPQRAFSGQPPLLYSRTK